MSFDDVNSEEELASQIDVDETSGFSSGNLFRQPLSTTDEVVGIREQESGSDQAQVENIYSANVVNNDDVMVFYDDPAPFSARDRPINVDSSELTTNNVTTDTHVPPSGDIGSIVPSIDHSDIHEELQYSPLQSQSPPGNQESVQQDIESRAISSHYHNTRPRHTMPQTESIGYDKGNENIFFREWFGVSNSISMRQLCRIPKDQAAILAKEESWLPSNSYPAYNVPHSIISDLQRRQMVGSCHSTDLETSTSLWHRQIGRDQSNSSPVRSGSESSTENEQTNGASPPSSDTSDEVYPWTPSPSQPRRRSPDDLPPDSSAVQASPSKCELTLNSTHDDRVARQEIGEGRRLPEEEGMDIGSIVAVESAFAPSSPAAPEAEAQVQVGVTPQGKAPEKPVAQVPGSSSATDNKQQSSGNSASTNVGPCTYQKPDGPTAIENRKVALSPETTQTRETGADIVISSKRPLDFPVTLDGNTPKRVRTIKIKRLKCKPKTGTLATPSRSLAEMRGFDYSCGAHGTGSIQSTAIVREEEPACVDDQSNPNENSAIHAVTTLKPAKLSFVSANIGEPGATSSLHMKGVELFGKSSVPTSSVALAQCAQILASIHKNWEPDSARIDVEEHGIKCDPGRLNNRLIADIDNTREDTSTKSIPRNEQDESIKKPNEIRAEGLFTHSLGPSKETLTMKDHEHHLADHSKSIATKKVSNVGLQTTRGIVPTKSVCGLTNTKSGPTVSKESSTVRYQGIRKELLARSRPSSHSSASKNAKTTGMSANSPVPDASKNAFTIKNAPAESATPPRIPATGMTKFIANYTSLKCFGGRYGRYDSETGSLERPQMKVDVSTWPIGPVQGSQFNSEN
ncbi:hypothetical protein EJ05DRAFT_125993 [Pseudovirgaria hyperparasitica]|uniref:Uncharacterized protein n=1 Tax=Pseudovirgaria hyperparasitica TaxID=470096 RepID=A0A6A6VZB8_9PEZI|nr:uncharacterized protein EJ05DRAFT_125993 [Pseudovirgaria hyperparasitica]KAF2755196.1 hypothetical protein EJ05DRAFT_125993 [Pseudovirgaria hyperparasitica]